MNIKKIIQNLLLSTGLFLIASAGSAFAASTYVVDQATATAGTAQSYEIEYTVDTAVQTWAAGDTLTVQLPANYPAWGSLTFTAEVDGDVTNDGTAETAITAGLGNGQYSVAGDTLQIKWDVLGGNWVVVNGATTIRVLITASASPTYADATSTFTFGGATAAADPSDPTGTDDVNVSAGSATATVALGTNSVVGVAGSTTITLTVPVALDTGDTIDITFPSYVDISGDAATPTGEFIGGIAFSCDDNVGGAGAQVLTCTAGAGTTSNTTGDLVLTGITTRYAGTTDITVFEIEDEGIAANDMSIVAAATLTNGTAATSLTALAADSTSVSTVGDSTGQVAITLTFPTALAATDTIKLTFPANYNLSTYPTPGVAVDVGLDNTVGLVRAGQVITITLDGAQSATLQTILLEANTITPYYADTAQNVAVLIEQNSAGAGGADVAASAADTGINTALAATTAHDANASVAFANAVVNGEGTVTLSLRTGLDLATNDTITMTMPAWINVPAGAIAVTSTTFLGGGTFTCAGVNGTGVVTCTVSAGAFTASPSTNRNIVLTATTDFTAVYAHTSTASDITNLAVNDNSNSDKDISADITVAVTTTTVGALSGTPNVQPQSLISGVESKNTISFTTSTTIPSGGKISVTYPSGWSVAGANGRTATDLSGLDGTWTATVSGQTVTFTQTSGTASVAGPKVLAISNGIMPPSGAGSGGTYIITTKIAAGSEIETDNNVSADTIAGGQSSSSDEPSTSTTTSTTSTSTTTTPTSTTTTTTTTETTTTPSTTTEDNNPVPSEENTVSVETKTGEVVTLTDLPETFWGTDVIQAMVSAGIVKGNEDGTFKPNSSLNRAEAAALLYRIMGLEEPAAPEMTPFSDVAVSEWYAGYVSELKDRKVVNGNPDGTFKPSNDINRAEFLKMAMSLYAYLADDTQKAELEDLEKGPQTTKFKDLDTSAWYSSTVTAAAEKGFIGGKACGEGKCFEANSNITRAEATQVLYSMFGKMLQVELPTE